MSPEKLEQRLTTGFCVPVPTSAFTCIHPWIWYTKANAGFKVIYWFTFLTFSYKMQCLYTFMYISTYLYIYIYIHMYIFYICVCGVNKIISHASQSLKLFKVYLRDGIENNPVNTISIYKFKHDGNIWNSLFFNCTCCKCMLHKSGTWK